MRSDTYEFVLSMGTKKENGRVERILESHELHGRRIGLSMAMTSRTNGNSLILCGHP